MKFFRFGSSTPPPPPPPSRPPAPPLQKKSAAKPAPAPVAAAAPKAVVSIIGQWREPDGVGLTEFRADGTLVECMSSGDTIQGRYALEDAKLRIQLEGVDELAFSASINEKELTLTDSEGQITRYQRA